MAIVIKKYNIPIDVIIHVILRFISYYDIDDYLEYFDLMPCKMALVKYKIYIARLKIVMCRKYIDGLGWMLCKKYMVEGKLHREGDLPALLYASGFRQWYRKGLLHNDKGPAEITAYGAMSYWLNDKPVFHFIHGKFKDSFLKVGNCKFKYMYDVWSI